MWDDTPSTIIAWAIAALLVMACLFLLSGLVFFVSTALGGIGCGA